MGKDAVQKLYRFSLIPQITVLIQPSKDKHIFICTDAHQPMYLFMITEVFFSLFDMVSPTPKSSRGPKMTLPHFAPMVTRAADLVKRRVLYHYSNLTCP